MYSRNREDQNPQGKKTVQDAPSLSKSTDTKTTKPGFWRRFWASLTASPKPRPRKVQRYPHNRQTCPNKGKYPNWSYFSSSTFKARRLGDGPAISDCSLCGYSAIDHGGNGLTDCVSAGLGQHP